MNRIGAALFALILTISARGETIQERGRRVINDAIAALGGDRFLHMQTRIESGRAYSFYREKLTGLSIARICTEYTTASNTADQLAVREREFFGKKEDFGVLFTEREAFDVSFRGARPLPEDRVARYKDTTMHDVLYILRVRLREPGMIFESRGADVWDNRPVEKVDITDSQDRVTMVYFDQTNKVPLRQVFYRRDPITKLRDEEVTEYSKYRDVNGIQWPHAERRDRNGEKVYEIFSEKVEIDTPLKGDMFTLPNNIKLLKPE